MNAIEKATELKEKFGSKAIERVDYALDVWNIKKTLRLKEMEVYNKNKDKYETAKRGYDISVRTLVFWDKVKEHIKKQ